MTTPTKAIPPWLELLAQVLTVAGVLLPAVGALTRFVAYWLTRIPAPAELATAAPLSDLAGLGGFVAGRTLLGVALLGVFVMLLSGAARSGPGAALDKAVASVAELTPLQYVALLVGWFLLFWLFLPVLIVATGMLAILAVAIAIWVSTTFGAQRAVPRVVMVTLVVGLGIGGGLGYDGPPASHYQFDPDETAATTGWYAPLGERSDFVYLLSCRRDEGVVAVPSDAVLQVQQRPDVEREAERSGPSILDVIGGRANWSIKLGIYPACPISN